MRLHIYMSCRIFVVMPTEIAVLEVIAEPTRRRILDAVRDGERSVGELVEKVGMHQPGVSRHLKVLRDAGWWRSGGCPAAAVPTPCRTADGARRMAGAISNGVGGAARFARTAPATHHRTDPSEFEGAPMSNFPSSSYDGTLERTADGGVIRFERHLPYPIRDIWTRSRIQRGWRTGGCRSTPTSQSTSGGRSDGVCRPW